MSKIYTDLNTVLTPYATAIKKNASDITSLNGSLEPLSALDNYIDVIINTATYTNVQGKYFDADGNETDTTSTTYYITSYISVTAGETIYISGKAINPNCHYVFYDGNYAKIAYGRGLNQTVIEDVPIEVPNNAEYVRLAAYGSGVIPAVKRIEGYQFSYKKWTGKKWSGVGDSITANTGQASKHYWTYINEQTGITFDNQGIVGTGFAKNSSGSGNVAYYLRMDRVPLDSDVVTIMASGNDASSNLSLGNPTDSTPDTIAGCINTTIDTLIARIPRVKLGIISTIPWESQPPYDTTNFFTRYTDLIKTICEYRSIPFLDLYHESNLRPWTAEGRAACYSNDANGVHPDEYGHEIIAPRIKSFLETLIM